MNILMDETIDSSIAKIFKNVAWVYNNVYCESQFKIIYSKMIDIVLRKISDKVIK